MSQNFLRRRIYLSTFWISEVLQERTFLLIHSSQLFFSSFPRAWHSVQSRPSPGLLPPPEWLSPRNISCRLWCDPRQGEWEGGRNHFWFWNFNVWTGIVFCYLPSQYKHKQLDTSLSVSAFTYWIVHAQNFALINLNQKDSFSLHYILLDTSRPNVI